MATEPENSRHPDTETGRWTKTYAAVVIYSIVVVMLLYLFSKYFGA